MIRVLIADDEQKVCDLIIHLINWDKLDMTLVGKASNGVDALKLIEEKKPDLVLTDIRMPGYSGLELMEKARAINPDLEFIIISGHSLFEYAQTAIQYGVQDYILKPVSPQVLDNTLQKARKRYLEKHAENTPYQDMSRLFKMIWYDLENNLLPPGIQESNEKYFCNFREGAFQIFCIHEDFKDYRNINIPYFKSTFDLLLPKAEAAMELQIKQLCYEFAFDSRNGEIYGILNYDPQKQKDIYEALRNVVNELAIELQAFEDIQLHVSASPQTLEFTELPGCLQQAVRAMAQRYFSRKSALLTDIPPNAVLPEENIFRNFNAALQKSIDLQSTEQLESAINALRDAVFSYSVSGSQVLNIVNTAYNMFLLSGISQGGYQFYSSEEATAEFRQKTNLCSLADDLFSLLRAVCIQTLEEACRWSNQEKIRPINIAKQYILEHYAEPLSLDEISSQAGFSSSYFSMLFRKETGITFSDYLANIRMEEAKKQLRQTRMTIEAVCESVGIHDYKRFAKSFKAATGISPREYRKLYS